MASMEILFSSSARRTPTCAMPRAAPPERARPMRGRVVILRIRLIHDRSHRVQDHNLGARLLSQIIDKLIDFRLNFFFGQIVFDAVAHLVERGYDAPAAPQTPVILIVAIRNLLGAGG